MVPWFIWRLFYVLSNFLTNAKRCKAKPVKKQERKSRNWPNLYCLTSQGNPACSTSQNTTYCVTQNSWERRGLNSLNKNIWTWINFALITEVNSTSPKVIVKQTCKCIAVSPTHDKCFGEIVIFFFFVKILIHLYFRPHYHSRKKLTLLFTPYKIKLFTKSWDCLKFVLVVYTLFLIMTQSKEIKRKKNKTVYTSSRLPGEIALEKWMLFKNKTTQWTKNWDAFWWMYRYFYKITPICFI